jgi:N-ethylmaleimide reductase
MSKSILFQPYTLGNSVLKIDGDGAYDRSRSNNEGNVPTANSRILYAKTAGLIVSEGTFVSTKAVGFINVPGL